MLYHVTSDALMLARRERLSRAGIATAARLATAADHLGHGFFSLLHVIAQETLIIRGSVLEEADQN